MNYIDRREAEQIMRARGFSTFREWSRAITKGQAANRRRGRQALVDALQYEYEKYVKPNL